MSINLANQTGDELTATGTGATPFEVTIPDKGSASVKLDSEGDTTITATASTDHWSSPPTGRSWFRMAPAARGAMAWMARAESSRATPMERGRRTSTRWPSRTSGCRPAERRAPTTTCRGSSPLGGVVRSGNINSKMPAWGQAFGGSLTRQQIEALTTMIGTWAQETLDNPPPEDVPEHGRGRRRGVRRRRLFRVPRRPAPGRHRSEPPDDRHLARSPLPTCRSPSAHLDQMQQDYDDRPARRSSRSGSATRPVTTTTATRPGCRRTPRTP